MAYSKSNTTNISFTGTSQSQPLSTKAKEIVLSATKDCYVSFDSTTVTSTNGFFVPANAPVTINILFPAQIAVIRETDDGTLSVLELGDSIEELKVTTTDTYTGDANLLKELITGNYTSDASLKAVLSETFTGDAYFNELVTYDATFTGDANLKREYEFVGDASLKAVVSEVYTGDANLVDTLQSLAFNGDAKLVTF